jgi:Flp pilus assembly protein TadG
MKLFKSNPNKSKAQAMVEFAIALPILLLLLYGLLETGRLLFIYASVTNATRQAARYGSTSGVGPNGVPRYQDCAGIRAAAQNGDFLNAFDDGDITITYDIGPGNSPYDTCTGATDTSVDPDSGDRVNVVINADYNTIVPNIVPLLSRTIVGNSSRTLIGTIDIVVTPPSTATFTFTPSPTPTLTFTPSLTYTPSRTPTITPTLQHTYTPSHTPLPATVTRTPTATSAAATPITGCNGALSLGLLTKTGNTMRLTVTNSHVAPLQISVVNVQWNHDKGHQTGGDKTLRLQNVTLGSTIWTGNQTGPTYPVTPSSPGIFPAGSTSTLIFTFHQSYDNWDNTESVTINLSTPGCEGVVFVQSSH